eukprot:CAMPEP_0174854750 /NCGR_PEP_ID=MMETSP1114-20130205/31930_1 /TAXON_ID=312471 /ORGANISM="Neobodo designis, Strain CCAP 1951/1" /LENGTH=188 /DNA_ID=CAMNT_0016089459 /DNA_START=83 /DNA_END=650 /DNA_ORIENTATION=-
MLQSVDSARTASSEPAAPGSMSRERNAYGAAVVAEALNNVMAREPSESVALDLTPPRAPAALSPGAIADVPPMALATSLLSVSHQKLDGLFRFQRPADEADVGGGAQEAAPDRREAAWRHFVAGGSLHSISSDHADISGSSHQEPPPPAPAGPVFTPVYKRVPMKRAEAVAAARAILAQKRVAERQRR